MGGRKEALAAVFCLILAGFPAPTGKVIIFMLDREAPDCGAERRCRAEGCIWTSRAAGSSGVSSAPSRISSLFAASVAVMSVDLGSEWMKMAIVKPGVPMEIVLNK